MPRGIRKTAGSQPEGGWLRRIRTGAAAAFSEGGDDDQDTAAAPNAAPTAAPNMTPRMREVGQDLLGQYQRRAADDRWTNAKDVAERTGVPVGTAGPLLMRYDAVRWTESKISAGSRLYRLTDAGAVALAEALDVPLASAPAPAAAPVVTARPAKTTTTVKVPAQRKDGDAPVDVNVAPAPAGKRAWTMSELEAMNPATAALVRRAMTRAIRDAAGGT